MTFYKKLFLISFFLLSSSLNAQSVIKVLNGTGFFISPNEIVTAHHAVDRKISEFIPITYNNKQHYAKVTKYNEELDVAYLYVNSKNNDYIKISKTPIVIGQRYTLYGYPSNNNRLFSRKHGIIKSLNLKFFSTTGRRTWERFVTVGTSGSSDGFSGGPILNSNGEVIGVLTNGDVRNAYFTSFESLEKNNSWIYNQ